MADFLNTLYNAINATLKKDICQFLQYDFTKKYFNGCHNNAKRTYIDIGKILFG